MKRVTTLAVAFSLSLSLALPACAETVKVVGNITKIQAGSPDAKSATVTLKDKNGKEYSVVIRDDETLGKLNKKIKEGDEVRTRFDKDTTVSSSFKKTAGCD